MELAAHDMCPRQMEDFMQKRGLYKKDWRNRAARRSGSTVILMALSMTTLLGCAALAVDYGLLVADANRLQRAADAAALAGAGELCESGPSLTAIATDTARARALAAVVAARNGVTISNPDTDITFPTWNRIDVKATTTRGFFFAAILGQRSGVVNRTAMAGRMPLRGVANVAPIAITTDDYNTYKNGTSFEVKLIRNQDTDFDPGTATSLDLRLDNSGKSGAVFQDDLQYGYSGTTVLDQRINSALNSELPSQGAKLESSFNWLIDQARLPPYNDNGNNYVYPDNNDATPDYPAGDPRIITIIVADPSDANNSNPQIIARKFVSVYIESVRSPGGPQGGYYFRMRILPMRVYNSHDSRNLLGDDTGWQGEGPNALVLLR